LSALPWAARIAVRTAHDNYRWTIDHIERDPKLIFRRQLKPHPLRVVLRGVGNVVRSMLG
jgi:hypothetical protein